MYTLLISIIIILAILLIIAVLLQSSKGGGLAGTFGGAANIGSMFGTRRTADFLSTATWVLAGSLLVLTVIINLFFLPGRSTLNQKESIINQNAPARTQQAPQQNP